MENLMIVAHPDDEIIFGYSQLLEDDWTIICVTNGENATRCRDFINVMNAMNVKDYAIWTYPDVMKKRFSSELTKDLKKIIKMKKWDKIVTHNPIGEYGHPHHRDIFEKVKSITKNFYIFQKGKTYLTKEELNHKLEILKLYSTEQKVIDDLLKNRGMFKSKDIETNYIENETITKYIEELDVSPFVECYKK